VKKLFNILLITLLLFGLFTCEVEPYEPACIQGEYIYGHLCTPISKSLITIN